MPYNIQTGEKIEEKQETSRLFPKALPVKKQLANGLIFLTPFIIAGLLLLWYLFLNGLPEP